MFLIGRYHLVGLILCILSAFAISNSHAQTPPATNTRDVLMEGKVRPQPVDVKERQATRFSALREVAMSVAMRSALADESDNISTMLGSLARLYDEAYDFGSLMLQGNIVPPVIQRADNVTETAGSDLLQYTGRVYKIKAQPFFATRPPTWRTYLIQPSFADVGGLNPALLPQNNEELRVWRDGVATGWDAGVAQARAIFVRNLYRLQSDFMGMMTYHWLAKANMVTPPIVSNVSKPLVGDATSLALDQVSYRIEAKPVFNPNMAEWVPFLNAPDPTQAERQILEIATPKPNLVITPNRPSREALMRGQLTQDSGQ